MRPCRLPKPLVSVRSISCRLLHARAPLLSSLYDAADLATTESSTTKAKNSLVRPQHAVISTFDLFSIGIGPSSSHTLGPWRAASIFVESLRDAGVLEQVQTLKVALYGSLAATGKGHMSPEALMMGFESEDAETIDTE